MILPRRRTAAPVLLVVVAVATLSACSNTPPPVPGRYSVVVTEPSGNIDTDSEQLWLRWTCDRSVDAETYHYETGGWTIIQGVKGKRELRAETNCDPGQRLTAQVDAAAVSTTTPTVLACQVYATDGALVVEKSITRGLGISIPICQVEVPGA